MKKRVLITGGAGFIGSHLTDELLKNGYEVKILDNLSPQVHRQKDAPPEYLNPEAEFIYGDIRDKEILEKALHKVDIVCHLAAAVGVGQSMYEIEKYVSVNNTGTAILLECLIKKDIERLLISSSMSVYGEGLYKTLKDELIELADRPLDQLKLGIWELFDNDGFALTPLPTPESKKINLASIYALSKYDQERMCLLLGKAYNLPVTALRFFNVYGPRQSLSNPYTGVLAIFASRLLNNKEPIIFEDGLQRRDFVSVYDIAKACRLAIEHPKAPDNVFNIGSGTNVTVSEIALKLKDILNKSHIETTIKNQYRVGDIRHCYADITKAKEILGYEPSITLENGLLDLAPWLEGQIAMDQVDIAHQELSIRGLAL